MSSTNAARLEALHRSTMRSMHAALFCLLPTVAQGDVVLAPLFQNHAVLQRDEELPVWGTARPAEGITVTLAGTTVHTTADASGNWKVKMPALAASAEPIQFIVTGDNHIELSNVVVGEVWLISGQSNAHMQVKATHDGDLEQRLARLPNVREFKVALTQANSPQFSVGGQWKSASPETVGSMSAVGYYFARDLHAALNVPVGIISSSWGATNITSWMESSVLASDPTFRSVHERWKKTVEQWPARLAAQNARIEAWKSERAAAVAKGERFTKPQPEPLRDGPGTPGELSCLYNAMIHPLVPYSLRGFLWYQGENNIRTAREYGALLKALIVSWRTNFEQQDAPFLFAQLAPHGKGQFATESQAAALREEQAAALSLPNTGMAVLADIGDPNDIHPKDKLPVARRLLRHALSIAYGDTSLMTAAPVLQRFELAPAKDGITKVRVHFEPSGQKLRFTSGKLDGFEVAGADRVFRKVEAELVDNTILLSTPDVPEPLAVRYLWRNAAKGTLENEVGLPVAQWRSDAW